MRLIIVTLLVLLLSSCGGGKPTLTRSVTEKDSTWTKVSTIKRDTIITIPGDSIKIRIPILDITEEPVTRYGVRSSASVRKENEDLVIDCKCDEYKQQIELMEKLIEQHETYEKLLKETVLKPERYVPWYIKILAWIGGISILGIGVIVTIKFIKPF
ncbi:MAG: hypothetical protein V7767_00620 [Leeuwenhoekiella sp.]